MKALTMSVGATAVILYLMLGAGNALTLNDCPAAWRNYTDLRTHPVFKFHAGSCYLFYPGVWDMYYNAQETCEKHGGTLAVIRSPESNEFIRSTLLNTWGISWPTWIGLDNNCDDSSPPPYSNWAPDHERYKSRRPKHICPSINPKTGQWIGHLCSHDYPGPKTSIAENFVCEYIPIGPTKQQSSDGCQKTSVESSVETTQVPTTQVPTTQVPTTPVPTTEMPTTPLPTCPPFVCVIDCGMDGYKLDERRCSVCECDF